MPEREIRVKYEDLYGVSGVEPNKYNMPHKGYKHPMRTCVWITLFIIGLMSALWFALGAVPNGYGTIPPAFGFGSNDMYFHSIAIGIAALLAMMVIMAFDLDKYEPNVDFPIAYRAMIATVMGSIGALFYIFPDFNNFTAPVGDLIMFIALLFLADVGGALLIQMYLLPAKLSGRYNPYDNAMGMFPKWRQLPTLGDIRKMDSAYFLAVASVASAFVAGLVGFLLLWINPYHVLVASPAFFNGYLSWIGGAATAAGYLVGSHSHTIGIAVMVGAVAIAAQGFKVLELKGLGRSVAKFGMWISIIGLIIMTLTFLLESFSMLWPNATPPLLFASNPGGPFQLWSSSASNGMAGDDSTMFLASLGAMILLIPLMLTKIRNRPAWKDPIRLSILVTWIIAYIATPIEGFFIEFNEATLHGTPTDIVFGNLQYFALFGLTMITLAYLAIDFFQGDRKVRKTVSTVGILVTLFALITGFVYVFMDPGTLDANGNLVGTTTTGWIFSIGLFLVSGVVMLAMLKVRSSGQDNKINQ